MHRGAGSPKPSAEGARRQHRPLVRPWAEDRFFSEFSGLPTNPRLPTRLRQVAVVRPPVGGPKVPVPLLPDAEFQGRRVGVMPSRGL